MYNFDSILMRTIDEILSDDYNTTPIKELEGLTPVQMHFLLYYLFDKE
ncbi:MAG: hypothetical protein QG635_1311, partial [Bacteroidota bacterium]|nr:hypothetical protein [Bacteroidota bacterium]